MSTQALIVSPGPTATQVIDAEGNVLDVPPEWDLLPPGDAGLTRRVKAAGPTWTVKQRRGRRVFSHGVWADKQQIAAARETLAAERSTEAYAKKRHNDLARRERKQAAYVEDFEAAVLKFLCFDSMHATVARQLAEAVTRHATPVGSGTVARTQRIPVQRRAESAVIAWMRHQTTAYDNLSIPRVKGKRREVRRMLAEQSRQLLSVYRAGEHVDPATCPLQQTRRSLTEELQVARRPGRSQRAFCVCPAGKSFEPSGAFNRRSVVDSRANRFLPPARATQPPLRSTRSAVVVQEKN